jgi:hypothetical protein
MPRRAKKRKPPKRRRKQPQPHKPAYVTYQFTNPVLEGNFTIELPAGWKGGLKLPRGKKKPRH